MIVILPKKKKLGWTLSGTAWHFLFFLPVRLPNPSSERSIAQRFAVSGLTPLTPPTAADNAVRSLWQPTTASCPGLKISSLVLLRASCFHSPPDRFTVARFAGVVRRRGSQLAGRRSPLEARNNVAERRRQNRNPPSETGRLKNLAGTFV